MKNFLCIDYGTVHTGVAYAVTPLAEPLDTIKTKDVVPYLKKLKSSYQIDALVVGLSEGEMAKTIKEFSKNLEEELALPIIFYDETLSSKSTRKKLAQAGAKRSKRQSKIDHIVAASILQEYLDTLEA